ncbi:hypothetical protein STAQ_42750 [Allostella sp. ATCC 35155]|nr:hypothetical protein STAQ_42750 [Stella sp. ATCC 35155]
MSGASATLIAAVAALAAGIAEPGPARRDPVAATSEAISGTLVPIMLADAIAARCRWADPAGAASRDAALARWRRANGVAPFEAALAAVATQAPELAGGRERMRAAAAAQAARTVAADPAACARLPATLAQPQYRIRRITTRATPLLHHLAAVLEESVRPRRAHAAR